MSKYINAELIKALMKNDRLMQGNAESVMWQQKVERRVDRLPSIDTEFIDFLFNVINPNEMEEYISMFKARAEQTVPQTERIKTLDYCDICNHKGCDNCIANNLDDYCVPSGYAPKDTPQTDCDTCRHYKLACELFSEICKYEPITQTETQNSNLTFEKDECAKEYEELGLKELKELINADRKTEPQTSGVPYKIDTSSVCKDEPQTSGVVWTDTEIPTYKTTSASTEPQTEREGE